MFKKILDRVVRVPEQPATRCTCSTTPTIGLDVARQPGARSASSSTGTTPRTRTGASPRGTTSSPGGSARTRARSPHPTTTRSSSAPASRRRTASRPTSSARTASGSRPSRTRCEDMLAERRVGRPVRRRNRLPGVPQRHQLPPLAQPRRRHDRARVRAGRHVLLRGRLRGRRPPWSPPTRRATWRMSPTRAIILIEADNPVDRPRRLRARRHGRGLLLPDRPGDHPRAPRRARATSSGTSSSAARRTASSSGPVPSPTSASGPYHNRRT